MENPVLNRILLVVSILGILFFTLYGLYSFTDFWRDWHLKLTKSSLSQKATSSDAANLKTYQNDFLSFTLKYPSNLTYTSESPKEPQLYEGVSFYDAKQGSSEEALFSLQINQVTPEDHRVFNLVSIGEPFIKDETSDTGSTRKVTAIPLSLNNISWVEQVLEENGQTTTVYLTTQKQDEAVYTISIFGPNDLPEQIVKTFSYTKT